ncbi:hypothetical protein BSKO_05983 [Bryopsis sp. KO-2023]|nr:hypothetical protein BSKO_05983 [Bryopsis sp. KO-2023]
MVQVEPNLSLTLEALAPSGATLALEKKAALCHSLPIRKAEAAVSTLSFWGKISTLNGKDYLVAEGHNKQKIISGKVILDVKYFYSQDGAKWIDLGEVNPETAERAATLATKLSGDSSQISTVEEANPDAPPPAENEEENEENSRKLVFEITELQRLRAMVDAISSATSVVPKGCETLTADCNIVPNSTFAGVDFPEKLESFIHRQGGPTGPSLATDIRGTWSLQHDPFKGITVCRSLVWLGYMFYYNSRTLTWGSTYTGDGRPNSDLVFMV